VPRLTLDAFKSKYKIKPEDWLKAGMTWAQLEAIFEDYKSRERDLEGLAQLVGAQIQKFPGVHSVRWRIKNAEHLLEKIVRKRAAGLKKYLAIDIENYSTVITDLVGIRALHLIKDECLTIGAGIKENYELVETPVIYSRAGDNNQRLRDKLGATEETHSAGYRSIHYVIESKPNKKAIRAEIQVRTIFEEGWSELDHRVRYPNFSDNKALVALLGIFNGIAGNADELISYIYGFSEKLSSELNEKSASAQVFRGFVSTIREKKECSITALAFIDSEIDKAFGGQNQAAIIMSQLNSSITISELCDDCFKVSVKISGHVKSAVEGIEYKSDERWVFVWPDFIAKRDTLGEIVAIRTDELLQCSHKIINSEHREKYSLQVKPGHETFLEIEYWFLNGIDQDCSVFTMIESNDANIELFNYCERDVTFSVVGTEFPATTVHLGSAQSTKLLDRQRASSQNEITLKLVGKQSS
jgi:putative GTP pyrophosphokinase